MVKKLSLSSTVLTILKVVPCQMCIYWLRNMDFQFCQPKFGVIPILQECPRWRAFLLSLGVGFTWADWKGKLWFWISRGENEHFEKASFVLHPVGQLEPQISISFQTQRTGLRLLTIDKFYLWMFLQTWKMGLQVPTVDKFLCCCELKTGVLLVGVLTLVSFICFSCFLQIVFHPI